MSATLVKAPIQPPPIDYSKFDRDDWQKRESDYIDTLATLAKRQHKGDTVGEVIRWQRADGYASYMVVSETPLRLTHLDLGDGYTVEPSLLRGLTLGEVRSMVSYERAMENVILDSNAIYTNGSLQPGDIVHYHNGFGQYVRCKVVNVGADWRTPAGSKGMGGIALKPIALIGQMRHQDADGKWVGGWSQSDLVVRRPDGTLNYGYHARQIMESELFLPNGGNIFENPTFSDRHGIDPRGMEPLSLELPAMTDEQGRIAVLAASIQRINSMAQLPASLDEGVLRVLLLEIVDEANRVLFGDR